MALCGEPSNLGSLQDVAERYPPYVLARVYPELVVFVVQDVFFRLLGRGCGGEGRAEVSRLTIAGATPIRFSQHGQTGGQLLLTGHSAH